MKYNLKYIIFYLFLFQTSIYCQELQYAFHIDADIDEAKFILDDHCFIFKKHLADLGNYYLAVPKDPLECTHNVDEHGKLIKRDSKILWYEPQIGRERSKRSFPINQNILKDQNLWYLNNEGRHNYDMHIKSVWRQNITGKGMIVSIIDDGIEKEHSELSSNYDSDASYDFVDGDDDPNPFPLVTYNNHGTRCAGVVAGIGKRCGVGIAYNTGIGGIRVLSDKVKDSTEAQGILFRNDYISVYSASWGPLDNGKSLEGPHVMTKRAFETAIARGRGGKGSIFVWASGNGGLNDDSCAFDGYVNLIYTLAVGSTTIEGTRPSFLESCSATMVSTFSGGLNYGISTTDIKNDCTDEFSGTSASAPMVAGIVALGLQVRPKLTWRDVQHVALRSTVTEFIQDGEWVTNSVGRKYSHKYGYGLITGARFVDMALKWPGVGNMNTCTMIFDAKSDFTTSRSFSIDSDGCENTSNHVNFLENVLFKVTISTSKRGCLFMTARSPGQTESTLIFTRKSDDGTDFITWPILTVAFWGEKASGKWTITITNTCKKPTHVDSVELIMYGTVEKPPFLEKRSDDIDCPFLVHFVDDIPKCVVKCPNGYCEYLHKCILCDSPTKLY